MKNWFDDSLRPLEIVGLVFLNLTNGHLRFYYGPRRLENGESCFVDLYSEEEVFSSGNDEE